MKKVFVCSSYIKNVCQFDAFEIPWVLQDKFLSGKVDS